MPSTTTSPAYNLASLNVVDLLLDALCIVEPDSTVVFVSPAFERIFGYAPQEAVGLRMLDLVHPDDRLTTQNEVQKIMQGDLQLEFENRYLSKDGRTVHIRWTARKAHDCNLRVALAHDITDRKNLESMQAAMYAISEAAHATDDLSCLFARVHAIVGELLASQDLAVVLYERASGQLTYPYPRRSPRVSCHIDEDPLCARVLRSAETVLEHQVMDSHSHTSPPLTAGASERPAGDARYWLGVPLTGAQGPIGVLVLQGDSLNAHYTQHDKALLQFLSTQVASAIESTRMRARLVHLAQFDSLTGLPNRQLLQDRMAVALARARRGDSGVCVLFVDLDSFKHVNDTMGHAAGDALLKQVGERLVACLRSCDTVARIGGDEFVVLIEGSHVRAEPPCAVARKIAQSFDLPFMLGEPPAPVAVQASLGLARFPDDGADQHALLHHADAAMYASKKAKQTGQAGQ